jgi:hypothetical protein
MSSGLCAIRPAREAGFDTERVKRKGVGNRGSGLGIRDQLSAIRYRLANLCYFGGAGKKRASQKPRATLRREFHAAQKVLKARVGAQEVELGCAFHIDIEVPWFVGSSIQPMQHFLPILEEPVLERDVQSVV